MIKSFSIKSYSDELNRSNLTHTHTQLQGKTDLYGIRLSLLE